MFSTLQIIGVDFWYYCHVYVWVYSIITSVIFGLYLQSTGVSLWYLGCIPAFNNIVKWRAGANPVVCFLSLFLDLGYIIRGGDFISIVVILLVHAFADFLFARAYCEGNAYVYAFVPLAKYWFMYKEVMGCRSTTKAKNIKKTSSTKKTSKTKAKKKSSQR